MVLASIDGNGAVSREALFAPEGRDMISRPQDCVEPGSEDMFIYADRKEQCRFGLIAFQ